MKLKPGIQLWFYILEGLEYINGCIARALVLSGVRDITHTQKKAHIGLLLAD